MQTQQQVTPSLPELVERQPPRKWKVVIYNDDVTPMDFVVYVLETIFQLPADTAINLMMTVHENGSAVVGMYPKAIADTLIDLVEKENSKAGHRLQMAAERD